MSKRKHRKFVPQPVVMTPRNLDLVQETAQMLDQTAVMIGEVTKVLHTQRWEMRESPFRGFGSPPGRF